MKDFVTDNWRDKVISRALAYADYCWAPTAQNACHGYDADGILVNTPDTNYVSGKYNCGWWQVDQVNRGIPYNWGGSSTLEDFNKGIVEGKFAGNVPDSRDNGISYNCVGVDCSGLVTICWGIENRLTTRSIPAIASPLSSMDLLLPGDVFLLPGSHVMIFIDFTDVTRTQAQIVDAGRSTGRVLLRTVQISELTDKGYVGYRKNT